MVRGDINMSMLRTAGGKIVTLIHNVCTPRPYDRGNLYMGTNGIYRSYPSLLMAWEEKTGDGGAEQYFSAEKALAVKEQYRHPFWKAAGEIAKKVGGHGGMDFIEDYRLIEALRTGRYPDYDVYDAAAWSAVTELSETSVANRSRPVDFPDFTGGKWKTNRPLPIAGA